MDQEPKQPKQQRVVVYVRDEDYRRLKAKLALTGQSVSGWFRETVRRFLSGK